RQLLRRLQLALGGDDPPPTVPLGLRLPGHGPFHRLGQGDVLDLHPVDVDTPVQCRAVDHQLEALVQPLAVGQQVVQVALADDAPQRRLRHLGHREPVVLHTDDGLHRVDHLEVDDRVDPDGDVVPGDAVLRGHRQRHDLHVDLPHAVDDRDDPRQPGFTRGSDDAAEPEDQTGYVLGDGAQPAGGRAGAEHYEADENVQDDVHLTTCFDATPGS